MPSWPASTIPQGPLVGTLEITSEPNVDEFRPDVYTNMIRARRYTAKGVTYSAVMLLQTNTEKLALETFFGTDCNDGVTPFEMTDWVDGDWRTFQWIAPPSFTHIALEIWRVAIQLLKMPGEPT